MKTIIAEKPSVAREIARIVGATKREEGYFEGGGYAVTWAFGHLVQLAMPDGYGIRGFVRDNLPVIPDTFTLVSRQVKTEKGYKPDSGVVAQIKTVARLFKESEQIIVATDAGRKGELIFRYLYHYIGCATPFVRLWISSLTDKAIRDGLRNLEAGSKYDNLYLAAKARSESDWLVGINGTQALSIAAGHGTYSVGRVQTPTLAMVCARYWENRRFTPEAFWQLHIATDGCDEGTVKFSSSEKQTMRHIEQQCGQVPLLVSTLTGKGLDDILRSLRNKLPDETMAQGIVGRLVEENDTVMLVMPQDIQAPKGRLILPQVQTIRELLDRKCLVMSCTTDKIDAMLAALARPPKLIITDSQVFRTVYDKKPAESRLTSFSVLFAQYKGDIDYYMEGANAIAQLTPESRVLIAEACTHAPLTEDIGRVKIPNMLRKRIGEGLQIDIVSGTDFPEDLTPYDLIIHCGACMFNRKYVLNRIDRARAQQVPMTNYGVTIAYLAGILDKIDY